MGRGIALHYLRQGSRVTVTGRNRQRGQDFLDEAARNGAAERAAFIQADLVSAEENRRVIQEVQLRHESLDGLVLTAVQPYPKRQLTPDGYESTFALYYISRFILSYGLTGLLERGNNPVIVSLGGTGVTKGRIHWDDLSLQHGYGLLKAMLQGGRANDLLGVAYAENHRNGNARFILTHPGYTHSGTNHISQPFKGIMQAMGKLFAQSVEESIEPILSLMDNPLVPALSAWDRAKAVDLRLPTLNKEDAMKLYNITKHIL